MTSGCGLLVTIEYGVMSYYIGLIRLVGVAYLWPLSMA